MTKWFLLAGAVGSEVIASLSLKAALTHPALYAVVLLGYVSAFTFLTLVLKRGMALGVAYGIWARWVSPQRRCCPPSCSTNGSRP